MAASKDYYELLGVDRTASEDDIRRAYRKLARKYHPDVNKDPDASRRFSEITDAYDVLGDKEKRQAYDRFGHAGVGAGSQAGAGPGREYAGAGPRTWTYSTRGADFDAGDLSDVFEEIFGGGARRAGPFGGMGTGPGPKREAAAQPRQRGGDAHHTLTVSFMTAAFGGTERVSVTTADGGTEQIDVKIPAGLDSGAKLRLKGRGESGRFGGERGDLILIVKVGNHPYFRREGLDLYVDVPLNLAEAALGTTITVPLLTGSAQVKIPAGASSGQKLRLKCRGIKAADGRQGDLFAVVQIVAPEQLSDTARSAMENLRGELQNPRNSAPWFDEASRASTE